MVKFNLGLDSSLYEGCQVNEVGGRKNLVTPPEEAANIIGRNAQKMVDAVPPDERDEVVLTGPMAVWAYLTVFHTVLHAFKKVVYEDGKGTRVVIAAHG